jgi:hypothetical protein
MTLISESRVASATASSTSSGIGGTIVLRDTGRLRVIVARGPSVYRIVSYLLIEVMVGEPVSTRTRRPGPWVERL